jgi:hypothetical protein
MSRMTSWFRVKLSIASIATLAACSAGGAAPDTEPGAGGSGQNGGGGGFDTVGGGGSGPADLVEWPEELTCPDVPQEVLVLDFRSGWWDDYLYADSPAPKPVLKQLTQTCDVTVEYHHIGEGEDLIRCISSAADEVCDTAAGGELGATLAKGSLDAYTQLWILSGSYADGSVVETTSLFSQFLEQSAGSCVPVFVGAGDGNVVHANAVAKELGLVDPFVPLSAEGGFAIPYAAVAVHSTMEISGHPLFDGVGALADVVTAESSVYGDRIEESPTRYRIVARDAEARPAIGVGAVVLEGGDVRPFVLDAGIQRYYAMFEHPDTRRFAEHVVMLLGSIGCKAGIPR